jgi:hypothetical protein
MQGVCVHEFEKNKDKMKIKKKNLFICVVCGVVAAFSRFACEVVRSLTVGQYVKQAEEVPADFQEEKVALVVVVLVVVELLLDGGIQCAVDGT